MSRALNTVRLEWDAVAERDTLRALRGLSDRFRKAAVRNAVRKGARPMLRAAKRRAPVEYGFTKKSLGTRVKTFRDGNVVAVTGPRRGPKFVYSAQRRPIRLKDKSVVSITRYQVKRVPANTAHLVEFGVAPHRLGEGVRRGRGAALRGRTNEQAGAEHPGMPARPFLRPAFAESRREAQAIVARELAREAVVQAQKEAARAARKAGGR